MTELSVVVVGGAAAAVAAVELAEALAGAFAELH